MALFSEIILTLAVAVLLAAGVIEWYFHRKRHHIKRVIEIAKED